MRVVGDQRLREAMEREFVEVFEEERSVLRDEAREKLLKIQRENKNTFDRRRKPARKYGMGELVAIQRTQFGGGLKLCPKFLGPYPITKIMRNDRYMVEKIGDHEGPGHTSSAADHMKPWADE